jgi:hypothetical protein
LTTALAPFTLRVWLTISTDDIERIAAAAPKQDYFHHTEEHKHVHRI